jgi:hypothetical protein
MNESKLFIGDSKLNLSDNFAKGMVILVGNDIYYRISDYDSMTPFLMNIASNSDLWMFISSKGGLTAGRKNADNSVFPYYTDDKIHDSNEITGSKTIIYASIGTQNYLWEAFSDRYKGINNTQRNIYKNALGSCVVFEEVNNDLNLSFRYIWKSCDRFGFVRHSSISNIGKERIEVSVLDGIQNILPANVNRRLQLEYSPLIDAYKKTELFERTGIAVYSLSSIPTDKAEPNESLLANVCWSCGISEPDILLSSLQLDDFRRNGVVIGETEIRAERGAYFIHSQFELDPNGLKNWYIIADVNKSQGDILELSNMIRSQKNITDLIENEILKDNNELAKKIAKADGIQKTSDQLNVMRQKSNVLFNIMRGGIFEDGYNVKKSDIILYLENSNKLLAEKSKYLLDNLPDDIPLFDLKKAIEPEDIDLQRLVSEYLPLTFSRRHGDPSRPWNHFSIDLKDENGKRIINYQGNWRDIFQNWEALSISYPEYLDNMIAKFLNSSTADGYNPYRVVLNGFDWEVVDPEDEWSYIGYWGDHQIIYLLKLLELSNNYYPENLKSLLKRCIFSYANVPYRIKPYESILNDPHNTVDFDFEKDQYIQEKVSQIGSDAKLLCYEDGSTVHANMLEKLLLPYLVKCSNFIPEAGIWMNTQRPEWNDANNALAGFGASIVTVGYMRRYADFLMKLFEDIDDAEFEVHNEIFDFFHKIFESFEDYKNILGRTFTDLERKNFIDRVGMAGSEYRINLYDNGLSGEKGSLAIKDILSFLRISKEYFDHTLKLNKRNDGLFHSYNLIDLSEKDKISIRNLYEMLEGQVAILSSGILDETEALDLLKTLRKSSLYRADQNSYILYPNRKLPRFFEKNTISTAVLNDHDFIESVSDDRFFKIFSQDILGNWHFKSHLRNRNALNEQLDEIEGTAGLTSDERASISDIYEKVFDHQSFTGRSGTMFKYEGLGSIYWHMVSKLLLAVQEVFYKAVRNKADRSAISDLFEIYYEIREGLGVHKSPYLFGAFPTDPYSHTPEGKGVQQPGMTGQVKEDIISRYGELGFSVENGSISFNPELLRDEEFLHESDKFTYFDVNEHERIITLEKNMLAFTICQVPVIYTKTGERKIMINTNEGNIIGISGLKLSRELSTSVFKRDDKISKIYVNF